MQKIKYKSKTGKCIFQIFMLLFTAILLAIVLRIFLFSTFVIPSPSMEPALWCGDRIVVNKLIPGPRIFRNLDFLEKGERPDMFRIKGIRSVRRNDILVFNFPYTDWNKLGFSPDVFYVKRCVAIPGDTFKIENGMYKVSGVGDRLGNADMQLQISRMPDNELNKDMFHCFPYHSDFNWNMKNFGPLYIPRKGDTITVDLRNYHLYSKLIEYETGKTTAVKSQQVYLDNKPLLQYVFTLNYYFMAGDLVRDSRDSRYWGLLPEDHIVGKASIIWKSVDTNTEKIRWDMVMKFIR